MDSIANYDDECTTIDAAAGMKLAGHGKGVQKSSWEIIERHNTAEIVLIASRVDIWRDRCDQRSCKILVSRVNLSENNANCAESLPDYTKCVKNLPTYLGKYCAKIV